MNRLNTALLSLFAITLFAFSACIDQSDVEHNTYRIKSIEALNTETCSGTVVGHIGHDVRTKLTMDVEYTENGEIPVQFYLLNKDDVEEVENGLGDRTDIRIYRPDQVVLPGVLEGEHEYSDDNADIDTFVFNIPSDQAEDELTGDKKTGTYYVIAAVDKDDSAEIDAYELYRKNPSIAEEIVIPTDDDEDPDLSVEDVDFAGDREDPKNIMTYIRVRVPDPNGFNIDVAPSERERRFTGNATIKSSKLRPGGISTINVPVRFEINIDDPSWTYGAIRPLVYDSDIDGWVEDYYIDELLPNTDEDVTVALQIDETDAGHIMDFLTQKSEDQENAGGEPSVSTTWTVTAYVNYLTNATYPVPEKRYTTGSNDITSAHANNTGTCDLIINFDVFDVEKNAGIRRYVPEDVDDPDNYGPVHPLEPWEAGYSSSKKKVLVIFHDEFAKDVGSSNLGGGVWAYERAYFYKYSAYQTGVELDARLFGYYLRLVDVNFDAFSFPKNPDASGYNFYVEAAGRTVYQEGSLGHLKKIWSFPIPIWGYTKQKIYKKWGMKLTTKIGVGVTLVPSLRLWTNYDGSLRFEKSLELQVYGTASAEFSVTVASCGINGYLKMIGVELLQQIYTETEIRNRRDPDTGAELLDSSGNPVGEEIAGALYKSLGVYLNGPEGWIQIWVKIIIKKYKWTMFSFHTFHGLPLWEMDTTGSGYWTNFQDFSPNEKNSVWDGIDWDAIGK
ncbi:MAG TPA: hypothetical protein PK926_08620 [Spirochaetota bacterium]|nr:hypothetical protein [Spirochaetota bacterium]HPI90108.1 hypothetical protein [Spirochaetota bacterium]HPR49548.1 hypothetical protein [Spirochaetota bacterium]